MNIIMIYIEVVFVVIQHPSELPVYLQKIPGLRKMVLFTTSMAATSTAVAVYTLRDYYQSTYWLHIGFLSLVHLLMFLAWGIIFGSVVDSLVRARFQDRPTGMVWQMISISLLSLFPFLFFIAFAIIGSVLFRDYTSIFVTIAALLLYVWSVYIALVGLQYLYELSMRNAIITFLKAFGIVFLFPILAAFFSMMEVLQMVL